MSFGSNVQPRKQKKPAGKPWVCGCNVAVPAYIYFCSKCQKGQSPREG